MPANLHLFSSAGEDDLRYILDASRVYLQDRDDPILAYLPMASLSEAWLAYTQKTFAGLAKVALINTETMTFAEMEAILRKAHALFIPGGNTFLLNHRLHVSRLNIYLRKKLQAGLPLLASSAGAILCGPNILTSRDMNMLETPHFDGLDLLPFNLHAHYYDDDYKDAWLSDYHLFQVNPVILLEDGAYLRVDGKKISLVRGAAWILRRGQDKEKLPIGSQIML
jgi:dipeptidase E